MFYFLKNVSFSFGNTFHKNRRHTCSQQMYSRVVLCYLKNKKQTNILTSLHSSQDYHNSSTPPHRGPMCFLNTSFTVLCFNLGTLLCKMSISCPSHCYFCEFAFAVVSNYRWQVIKIHKSMADKNSRDVFLFALSSCSSAQI